MKHNRIFRIPEPHEWKISHSIAVILVPMNLLLLLAFVEIYGISDAVNEHPVASLSFIVAACGFLFTVFTFWVNRVTKIRAGRPDLSITIIHKKVDDVTAGYYLHNHGVGAARIKEFYYLDTKSGAKFQTKGDAPAFMKKAQIPPGVFSCYLFDRDEPLSSNQPKKIVQFLNPNEEETIKDFIGRIQIFVKYEGPSGKQFERRREPMLP
ncbi:MAG: hypothetical protein AAF065_14435 [Verrucomicrobiota bacterium]